MKHKLYKLLALSETVILVVTMGACSKKIEVSNTKVEKENPEITTMNEMTVPTTFSIFDDSEEIIEESKTEKITETKPEIVTENIKTAELNFSSQEELEVFLTKTYEESGKTIQQIHQELIKEYENGNYLAYNNIIIAAAAYRCLVENGYTLDDFGLLLDYLLYCRIYSGELTYEEEEMFRPLFEITESYGIYNTFEFFERLAVERHRVKCPEKENHRSDTVHDCVVLSQEYQEQLFQDYLSQEQTHGLKK